MTLICHVCKFEFEIPKLTSKLYYPCPKCHTVLRLWYPMPTTISKKEASKDWGTMMVEKV